MVNRRKAWVYKEGWKGEKVDIPCVEDGNCTQELLEYEPEGILSFLLFFLGCNRVCLLLGLKEY